MSNAMEPITLEIPVLPVSFNRTRYAHWQQVRREAQPFKDALLFMLRCSDLPKGCPSIVATADLRFPTRRRRDEGNFRTPLEKSLGDALVREGYLDDDTPDQFRMERVTLLTEPGPPSTLLYLRISKE